MKTASCDGELQKLWDRFSVKSQIKIRPGRIFIRLTQDEDSYVREKLQMLLESAFSHVPETRLRPGRISLG